MKKILVIQTAFIGDVILATSLIETLVHYTNEECEIDVLVRKGSENLLESNPNINRTLVWNKKEGKYKSLFKLIKELRKTRYAAVYNIQRFGTTGFLTWRLRADKKVGFSRNPYSFAFDRKVTHEINNGKHEVERNFELIKDDLPTDAQPLKPKLYPSSADKEKVKEVIGNDGDYIVLAPASVWFTKQLPKEKWVELLKNLKQKTYLIGAPSDTDLIDGIIANSGNENAVNLAGKLTLVQSAELIGKAERTYVNDSAPLHLASAMDAPVTAFFCSTVPDFGFGPLSTDSVINQTTETLDCRPCGLHGHKSCPQGHFKCGMTIDVLK